MMDRVLFFLILLGSVELAGCSTVALSPQAGVGVSAVEAVAKPAADIRAVVPSDPKPECERDARIFYFVTHLPAISEVYQFDLYLSRKAPNASEPYLSRKAPNASEPKRIGDCVLNPFNPQNVAEQEPKHE